MSVKPAYQSEYLSKANKVIDFQDDRFRQFSL